MLEVFSHTATWLLLLHSASRNKENAVGIVRYRVQMTDSDASDSAEFVASETKKSTLTNIGPVEVSQEMNVGLQEHKSWALPQCIEDIVQRHLA